MATHTGYLLIADISGYTAYLTQSEMEHANPILRSLLEVLVMQVGEPLHLWRMEGDAVLAYTTAQEFPSGETFLAICENLYQAFAARRLDIIQNTTCTCNACANVGGLDLKILAHHGSFEEMRIGPMTDISGADVILVHRMAKTDVKEATGIRSYALFSQAAYDAMGIETELLAYSATFEHFGDVPMRVYDLAEAWKRHREQAERHYVTEEEAVFGFRHPMPVKPAVAWQMLTSPTLKVEWMGLKDSYNDAGTGRVNAGTRFHCIHELAAMTFIITDWRPFEYFSTVFTSPMHPELGHTETYELIPTDEGCELVYRMGPLRTADGEVRPKETDELMEGLYGPFWPNAMKLLDGMIAAMD